MGWFGSDTIVEVKKRRTEETVRDMVRGGIGVRSAETAGDAVPAEPKTVATAPTTSTPTTSTPAMSTAEVDQGLKEMKERALRAKKAEEDARARAAQ